jgi:hypothetical protein
VRAGAGEQRVDDVDGAPVAEDEQASRNGGEVGRDVPAAQ